MGGLDFAPALAYYILGLLFFILCINDLPKSIRDAECLLLPDDTGIFFYQNCNYKTLMEYLNHEICHVVTWLKANKLPINDKKTTIMIFRPKQMKPLVTGPLKIDNAVIEEVEHIKFLGVYIDQHLA